MAAELFDYIVLMPGLLPTDICQAIIKEYALDPEVKRAQVEGNVEHPDRNCSQLLISQGRIVGSNPRRQMIEDVLKETCLQAGQRYRSRFPDCRLRGTTGHLYVKYDQGGFYKQHVDQFPVENRQITLSIALNDTFEGGEWAWFDRELTQKLRVGEGVMFPSTWMYPHEILPVTSGTRHAVLTWYKG